MTLRFVFDFQFDLQTNLHCYLLIGWKITFLKFGYQKSQSPILVCCLYLYFYELITSLFNVCPVLSFCHFDLILFYHFRFLQSLIFVLISSQLNFIFPHFIILPSYQNSITVSSQIYEVIGFNFC